MTEDQRSSQKHSQLSALALRLETDSLFMAYVLKQYCDIEEVTEAEVVQQLETTPEMFVRLALCKRPDSQSPQFSEQLEQLVTYTGIQADYLYRIIDRVDQGNP